MALKALHHLSKACPLCSVLEDQILPTVCVYCIVNWLLLVLSMFLSTFSAICACMRLENIDRKLVALCFFFLSQVVQNHWNGGEQ